MKPSELFRREIKPALDDYLAHPLDERLANNVARAIDHFADWTFKYHKEVDPSRLSGATDEKSFRAQLLPQCPELQMMNDLSDAAHHRFLDRPNNPPRVVTEFDGGLLGAEWATVRSEIREGVRAIRDGSSQFLA